MAELLVGADVESEVRTELNLRMPETPYPANAETRIPDPKPADFIRVIAAGGAERDLVTDSPTITIEGWSTSEARAQRICAYAIAVLQAASRDGWVGAATCYGVTPFGLPVNLPHPQVPDRFRYTATVSVDLRKVGA